MKFSVLMSIYNKEKVIYFNRAMESIWDTQTVKPHEIVLVKDGLLTKELEHIIQLWKNKIGESYKIVSLAKNQGLGEALNIGLQECSNELIARMDTDDISTKDRFKKQLKVFEDMDIDICGSWVSEFEKDEKVVSSYRKLPQKHNELVKFSKERNPLNHPAVMYKKSVVQNAGGYKHMPWFEDYYLWVRMIISGAKLYNIQEPLVNMRAGYAQLERRGGLKYAISEFKLQKEFLNLGFINIFEFTRNVTIRFISRIVPKYILKKIYSRIRT